MTSAKRADRSRRWRAGVLLLAGFYGPGVLFFTVPRPPGGDAAVDQFLAFFWLQCFLCAGATASILLCRPPTDAQAQARRVFSCRVLGSCAALFLVMMPVLLWLWVRF